MSTIIIASEGKETIMTMRMVRGDFLGPQASNQIFGGVVCRRCREHGVEIGQGL